MLPRNEPQPLVSGVVGGKLNYDQSTERVNVLTQANAFNAEGVRKATKTSLEFRSEGPDLPLGQPTGQLVPV